MTVDPKAIVSLVSVAPEPLRLSELDALCDERQSELGGRPAPEELTSGLAIAIRCGWLHTDGLRLFVSGSGRQLLNG
jgi:hypothetical protein